MLKWVLKLTCSHDDIKEAISCKPCWISRPCPHRCCTNTKSCRHHIVYRRRETYGSRGIDNGSGTTGFLRCGYCEGDWWRCRTTWHVNSSRRLALNCRCSCVNWRKTRIQNNGRWYVMYELRAFLKMLQRWHGMNSGYIGMNFENPIQSDFVLVYKVSFVSLARSLDMVILLKKSWNHLGHIQAFMRDDVTQWQSWTIDLLI